MFLNNLLNLDSLENLLRNTTFLTLFFTTILYWGYTAFNTKPLGLGFRGNYNGVVTNQSPINVTTFLPIDGNSIPNNFMAISNIFLVLLLLVRWEKSGHFPLSNLYESLMFLAWCCTFLYLIYTNNFNFIINLKQKNALKTNQISNTTNLVGVVTMDKNLEKILGSITVSCALLMNAFATFSLPKEMQQAAPLVPALQSNWLMMHVTVMIISYATLIIGSLLSIFFLILQKTTKDQSSVSTDNWRSSSNTYINQGAGSETINPITQKLFNLDELSYRIIGLGFPFLTIGILSGAVWANEAWGSYWSWDPKETWALLTWLVFAIYLHTRLTKGWQGEKPAIIASLGFVIVWFCYLGVNLLGEGLHSYGFF